MSRDSVLDAALARMQKERESLTQAIDLLESVRLLGSVKVSVTFESDTSADDVAAANKAFRDIARRRGDQVPLGDDDDGAARNPGGADGAFRILKSTPKTFYSPKELADAMLADGWRTTSDDPPRAARAAANRLRRNGEKVFLIQGRFTYDPDSDVDPDDAHKEGEEPT